MINNNSNVVFDTIDLEPIIKQNVIYMSKVLDNDSFFTCNQVAIYNLLEFNELNIDYSNYFYIFETIESLELHNLTNEDERINEITCINKDNNYLLVRYQIKNLILLDNYLSSSKTNVIYYKRLIDSFKQILNCLELLNNFGIVHNNLQDKSNILVDLDKEHVLLSKFSLSFLNNNINLITENKLKQYYKVYEPGYYYWPIEIHLLTYLLYKCDTLSKHNINTVINDVYKDSRLEYNFNLENSKKEAKEYFEQFVNMKREEAIDKLVSYSNSWDLYSICCIFLSKLNKENKNKNNLFIQLTNKLLLACLRPNPEKRYNVSLCFTNFNKIINNLNINIFYDLVLHN